MRFNDIDLLLGPTENQLDDYAEASIGEPVLPTEIVVVL